MWVVAPALLSEILDRIVIRIIRVSESETLYYRVRYPTFVGIRLSENESDYPIFSDNPISESDYPSPSPTTLSRRTLPTSLYPAARQLAI